MKKEKIKILSAKETIELIQSRCVHRRIGVMSEKGYKFLYCQDCEKEFPEKEIR